MTDPTDEEIMELMPQQMRDDLAAAARALAEQAGTDSRRAMGIMRIILNRHAVDHVRAALAKWGPPMTDLSPAADAVLDAYNSGFDRPVAVHHKPRIAAALRAAVDQVIPEVTLLGSDYQEIALQEARKEILAIADELENQ
jgi:hypothetical protein